MIIAKRKNFLLINKQTSNKKIFEILIKKIPNSIFSKLDYKFLKKIIEKKIIKLYVIMNQRKIFSLVTTVSYDNYNLLKKKILVYLIKKPHIILFNLRYFFNIFNRDSNEINLKYKNNYLHLLHLIILKDKKLNKNIKLKDELMSFFYKIILKKNNAKLFYLCYEKKNLSAHKYYKRNNFKIYKKNNGVIYIEKKFL